MKSLFSRPTLALAAYYVFVFIAAGTEAPFWPLWLSAQGLDAPRIGVVLATTYLASIIATPIAGIVSDRLGLRKLPMVVLGLVAASAWALFGLAPGFIGIIAINLLAQGAWTGLMPLGETLALATAHHRDLDYGRIRVWGSLSFIAAALGMGAVLELGSPGVLVWVIAGSLGATALSCCLLEDVPVPPHHDAAGSLRGLITEKSFLWFLATCGLTQGAHILYYGFSTLYWSQAGLSPATIGLLWGEAVLAEVALFVWSRPVIDRLGPRGLLIAAAVGGIVRWTVLGSTTALWALGLAQLLHAATFCAAHLGAMVYIRGTVAPSLSARAQGLYAGVAWGLGPGAVALISGPLYATLHGGAFYVMTALAALALVASLKVRR